LIIAMPFKSGGIRAAEVGEPVVVRAKDGGHQRRVRHLEVKEPLRGIEDFTGHPIERHVLEMLLGVVPAALHVLEAPLAGDGLGRFEPRAGVRDQADAGEDLIGLDHDLVGAVDPLQPRRTVPERRIDAGLPQIGRFEHVRVRREYQRQHRHLLFTRSRAAPLATGPSPSRRAQGVIRRLPGLV
jgi:hypothetical protein